MSRGLPALLLQQLHTLGTHLSLRLGRRARHVFVICSRTADCSPMLAPARMLALHEHAGNPVGKSTRRQQWVCCSPSTTAGLAAGFFSAGLRFSPRLLAARGLAAGFFTGTGELTSSSSSLQQHQQQAVTC